MSLQPTKCGRVGGAHGAGRGLNTHGLRGVAVWIQKLENRRPPSGRNRFGHDPIAMTANLNRSRHLK
jgi:hypothetical protein